MPPVTEPLVSVVIPTHNRADLLGGAIDSVLSQQGGDVDAPDAIEVIVVDDASTDDTSAVLDRYRHLIVRLRNERGVERAASRNRGARAARGRWLAFLDSDDEWEDRKLAAQLHAMADGESACLTGCWLINQDGEILGMDHRSERDGPSSIEVLNRFRAVPSTLLIDRELFLELGGFPEEADVQGSEDWLFMAKLLGSGRDPIELAQPLVRYRVHSGNSTATPQAYLRSGLAAVQWLEHHGLTSPQQSRIARSQKYEVAARAYALQGQIAVAGRLMRHAAVLSDDPAEIFRRSLKAGLIATRNRILPLLLDNPRDV
jgi:teichuronic acid biosynthesis glycosyltransferase TuaG